MLELQQQVYLHPESEPFGPVNALVLYFFIDLGSCCALNSSTDVVACVRLSFLGHASILRGKRCNIGDIMKFAALSISDRYNARCRSGSMSRNECNGI